MWVYSYYWNGQNKVQSSWSQWKFDADILAITFVQDEIFMVVQRASKVYLEKIKLSQDEAVGITDNNHEILLDRRVKLTTDASLDDFTTNYYADGAGLKYIDKEGDILTETEAQTKTIVLSPSMSKMVLDVDNALHSLRSNPYRKSLENYFVLRKITKLNKVLYLSNGLVSVKTSYNVLKNLEINGCIIDGHY